MEKDEVKVPYIYDTPTGIVEKEGLLFRGMTSYDSNRPVWVKILIVFFSLLIFVLPWLFISWISVAVIYEMAQGQVKLSEGYQWLFGLAFGVLLLIGGVMAIYQNIRIKHKK